MITRFAAFIFIALLATDASARSAAEVRAFRHEHHCPATGKAYGKCPGWIVDHIVPLCAGGADDPANMQWQTKQDALAKDKQEWRTCRQLKKRARKLSS